MSALRRRHEVYHVKGESAQTKAINTHTSGKHKMNQDNLSPSRSQRYSLCTIFLIATPILVFVVLTFVNAIYTIQYIWQLRPRSTNVKGPICNRILRKRKTSMSEISWQDLQQLSSRQFYDRYVQTRQGVVIRGAYDNHTLSINREVFSDETIRKQFSGDEGSEFMLSVETAKVENRDPGNAVPLSMQQFVDNYKNKSMYVVTDIGAIIQQEEDDPGIQLEKLLLPSIFEDFLQGSSMKVGPLLWWSSGGTKSVIHVDSTNNFESIFYGRKVCMFDKCSACNCGFCYSLPELLTLIFTFHSHTQILHNLYSMGSQDLLYCRCRIHRRCGVLSENRFV